MSIIKVDYGEVGGGNKLDYQVIMSRNLNCYVTADGETLDAKPYSSATSYEDDYIKVTRAASEASNCTIKVKKACTRIKTKGTTITSDQLTANTQFTIAMPSDADFVSFVF